MAQIDSIPDLIGNGGVEVISNRAQARGIKLHTLRFPTIRSSSVEIHITDALSAWSFNLKCIRRTAFECVGKWIIQSWCVNLIINVLTSPLKLLLTGKYIIQKALLLEA